MHFKSEVVYEFPESLNYKNKVKNDVNNDSVIKTLHKVCLANNISTNLYRVCG